MTDRFTRRHLPHWEVDAGIYFITFRLAGSLPEVIEAQIKENARRLKYLADQPELRRRVDKKLFALVEKHLADACAGRTGPLYLERDDLAEIVYRHLLYGEELKRYILHRFCTMPNHVHILLEPLPVKCPPGFHLCVGWSDYCERRRVVGALEPDRQERRSCHALSGIMKGLKGNSSRQINLALGRNGTLWQDESFDHWVRDNEEYDRIIRYIDQNPVHANLCSVPEAWKHSSLGRQAQEPVVGQTFLSVPPE